MELKTDLNTIIGMQPRTRRQREVLDYVKHFIEKHGYEPSYQQIARQIGVRSKSGIAKHIEALENQGLISRVHENGSFRLEINPAKSVTELISLVEWLEVPADDVPAEDWARKPLFVPKFMLEPTDAEKMRAYLVANDSMLDENICAGDIALIETRSYARDGDIVVGLPGKKRSVLRRFFRAGANCELRSANPDFETIVVPADQVEIKGLLRGILRTFG